jgi:hypothetical protein
MIELPSKEAICEENLPNYIDKVEHLRDQSFEAPLHMGPLGGDNVLGQLFFARVAITLFKNPLVETGKNQLIDRI